MSRANWLPSPATPRRCTSRSRNDKVAVSTIRGTPVITNATGPAAAGGASAAAATAPLRVVGDVRLALIRSAAATRARQSLGGGSRPEAGCLPGWAYLPAHDAAH